MLLYIERNLSMSNGRPWMPTRLWRRMTGPGLSSRTASATAAKTGRPIATMVREIAMSSERLSSRCDGVKIGVRRPISGRPSKFSVTM